ncbi:hypothetical protein [Actinomycetospora sp. TBRC 11914]|uniref:hypothetical protein n=1 Tax=Actinomycetospora sp. TBRC 11914 TaxID=2729387 RepID=UPI00145E3746|nr:hypothetical protein [Actinomycetospora sp. TBRC 11914]NMO92336.1 hypothetical protein [Actinomycetospora sp. TBRC 11914]
MPVLTVRAQLSVDLDLLRPAQKKGSSAQESRTDIDDRELSAKRRLRVIGHSVDALYVPTVNRVIGVIIVILVLFWIISAPRSAAATVDAIFAGLASIAHSIIVFVENLFS